MEEPNYEQSPSEELIGFMLEGDTCPPSAIEELTSGRQTRRDDLIRMMDASQEVQLRGVVMSILIDHYLSPESIAAIERFRDSLPLDQQHSIEAFLEMVRGDPGASSS